MNKTRRRAIQKHRAKDTKFEVRRKLSGDHNEPKGKAGMMTQSTARARTTARRATGAESAE